MSRSKLISQIYVFLLLFAGSVLSQAQAQSFEMPTIDQVMISRAEVRDKALIAKILEVSMITESPDQVERIYFLDVTNNGFGDNDMIVTYPSNKVYMYVATDEIKQITKHWPPVGGKRLDLAEFDPEFYENLDPAQDSTDMALKWMMAGTLRSINNNLVSTDMPIKLFFERSEDGIKFNVWGYEGSDADALKWKPENLANRRGETERDYDIVRILREAESKIIERGREIEAYYLYHSVKDTVFMAPPDSGSFQPRPDSEYIPGLVSPNKEKPRVPEKSIERSGQ